METRQRALVWAVPLILLAVLSFFGLYLFRELTVGRQLGFPLDDSWIHVRIAQNIRHGYGFSFNKGVYAAVSTEPLWTVLLAFVLLFVKQPIAAAYALGLVTLVLSCFYSFKLAFLITGNGVVSAFASIVPAFLPFLTWGSMSGMGVPLFVLLTVMGIYYHMLLRRESGLRQYAPTLIFALAALARPECFLLFGFSTLDYLWFAVRGRRPLARTAANVALHGLVFCLLTSPFFAFNYATSGHLFPNTYYAKNIFWLKLNEGKLPTDGAAGAAWFYFTAWLEYNLHLFLFFCRSTGWLLAVLLPFGLYRLFKATFSPSDVRPGLGIIPLVAFGYPLVVSVQNVAVFGTTYVYGAQGRYFTNLLVVWAFVCSLGVGTIGRHGRRSKYAALLLMALVLGTMAFKQWGNSLTYAMNVKNVNEMNVAAGKWLDRNVPPDARLAIHDVGAIACFSDREVIDILGLVNPDAWPYLKRGQRGIFEYIKKTRPDYLIVFPKWFPLIVSQKDYFQPVHGFSIDDNTIVGSDLLVVYKCNFGQEDN